MMNKVYDFTEIFLKTTFLINSSIYGVSYLTSTALNIEEILEIIPELKCFFAGSKSPEQVMQNLRTSEHSYYVKTFLLSDEKECPIINVEQKIYQNKIMTETSEEIISNYQYQYYHNTDEV